MVRLSMILTLIFLASNVYGQEKATLLRDKFKGNIALSGDEFANTTLTLEHKPSVEQGNFTLDELFPGSKFEKPAHVTTTGDWTVLKGVTNKNGKIIELNAMGGRILFFLWLKNGSVQHLDMNMHEMYPAPKHILRKQ